MNQHAAHHPPATSARTLTDGPAQAPDPSDRRRGELMPLAECRDASLTFGSGSAAVVAVHGTSCAVLPGARIAIAGPSGSGKSTFLHLIGGLERPTTGSVTWPALSENDASSARGIGVVFQGPSLIPTLSVTENVAVPLILSGTCDHDAQQRARDCLARVRAEEFADKLPEELSGGQAQRAAVARVLAQAPALILADEPTGQLDHDTGRRVVDALLAAADEVGAALVVTSHDPRVTERLAERWTMHEGRLDTAPLQPTPTNGDQS